MSAADSSAEKLEEAAVLFAMARSSAGVLTARRKMRRALANYRNAVLDEAANAYLEPTHLNDCKCDWCVAGRLFARRVLALKSAEEP